MTAFKFQADLIETRLTALNAGNTFIAMDAGLGKTLCAIEAARRNGVHRAIVTCPSIGLVSWPAELEKWWPEAYFANVNDPDLIPRAAQVPDSRPTWLLAPYSEISRNPTAFIAGAARFAPELMVLDEAQALANGAGTGADALGATRTRAVYGDRCDLAGGMAGSARTVWPMSGTPAPNYTSELWTHLNALAPHMIAERGRNRAMSYQEFLRRYATTRVSAYDQHVTGSVNTAELRARTDGFFYRVRKRDVLKDLPDVLWTYEPLPITADQASAYLDNVPAGLEGDALNDWLRQAYPHGSSERKALGLAKIAGAVEWARAFLTSCDRKLIMFAWHTDVVNAIAAELDKEFGALAITGATPHPDRVLGVKAFQTQQRPRVVVGQMAAAGTSITLTAASDVAFVEDDWTPGSLEQAVGRADRIGQTRGVIARLLYVPGSKDEAVAKARAGKAREINVMFNGAK